jgi:hypothetical protein
VSTLRVPSGFTEDDAAIIKGMIARGDRQSDIAAYFGTNGGRISEINTGTKVGAKFAHVRPAPLKRLPPPGPYLAGRSALKARDTLLAALDMIQAALVEIDLYEQVRGDE